MSRQAIADARSLLEAAWNEPGGTAHRVLIHKALTALCDAVESLDRDEGPRLPLSADEWEMRADGYTAPDNRPGWFLVAPIGIVEAEGHWDERSEFLWARKREGGAL